MLIEFKVKNFRSFKDEAVLSMVASADKSLPDNFIMIDNFGKRRILHSAVIYGANAAGKTNLISAVEFVHNFTGESTELNINETIFFQPFLLSIEKENNPTEFELTFLDNHDIRYQYGFHLNNKKIIKEWLIAYPKGLPQTWFEREINSEVDSSYNWYFGRNLKGQNKLISELCRPVTLFLSIAAKMNHKQLTQVLTWVQDSTFVFNTKDIKAYYLADTVDQLSEEKDFIDNMNQLIKAADFGIAGFNINEESISDQKNGFNFFSNANNKKIDHKRKIISMRHQLRDNKEISFPINVESNGTQQLFILSIPMLLTLQQGLTLFIDELDSSLHPNLVQYIIQLFHNPNVNKHNAQIIFNTHDTTILNQDTFRRDQIWFVEKDNLGCSHLYSLLEYSPRNSESLAKNYLEGRYGAIPFFGEWTWEK